MGNVMRGGADNKSCYECVYMARNYTSRAHDQVDSRRLGQVEIWSAGARFGVGALCCIPYVPLVTGGRFLNLYSCR